MSTLVVLLVVQIGLLAYAPSLTTLSMTLVVLSMLLLTASSPVRR